MDHAGTAFRHSAATMQSDQLDHPSSVNSDDAAFSEMAVVSSLDAVRQTMGDLLRFSQVAGAQESDDLERFSVTIQMKLDLVCSNDQFARLLTNLESKSAPASGTETVVHTERPLEPTSTDKFEEKIGHVQMVSTGTNGISADTHRVQEMELPELFEFFGQDQGTEVHVIDGRMSPRSGNELEQKAELDREYDIDANAFDFLTQSDNSQPGQEDHRAAQDWTHPETEPSNTIFASPSIPAHSPHRSLDNPRTNPVLQQEPLGSGVLRLKEEIQELYSSVDAFLSPDLLARARSLSPAVSAIPSAGIRTTDGASDLDSESLAGLSSFLDSFGGPHPPSPFRDTLPAGRGAESAVSVPRPPCPTPEEPPQHPHPHLAGAAGPRDPSAEAATSRRLFAAKGHHSPDAAVSASLKSSAALLLASPTSLPASLHASLHASSPDPRSVSFSHEDQVRMLQAQGRTRASRSRSPVPNRPCKFLEMSQSERRQLSKAARQKREERELQFCTFRPKISQKSKEILKVKVGDAPWTEPGDLAPIPRRMHASENPDLTLAPSLASGTKKIEGKARGQRKVLLSRTVQGLDLHASYTPSVTNVVSSKHDDSQGCDTRLHRQAEQRIARRSEQEEEAVQREQAEHSARSFLSSKSRRILSHSPAAQPQPSLTRQISCQAADNDPRARTPSPPRSALRGPRSTSPGTSKIAQLSRPKVREVSFGDVEVETLRDSSSVPMLARALAVQDMKGHWPYGPPERFASPSQIRSMSLAPSHLGEEWGEGKGEEAVPGREERRRSREEAQRKEVGGIGIQLTETAEGGFIIEGMTPDGPAALASKVWVGDEVLSVDGVRLHGKGMHFAASHIQGPPGAAIRLSLLRRSFAPGTFAERRREFSLTLTRVAPPAPKPAPAVVPVLGVKELAKDIAATGTGPVTKFKSPRNHEPFNSPRTHDHLQPPPPPRPRSDISDDPPAPTDVATPPKLPLHAVAGGTGADGVQVRDGVSPGSGAPSSWYRASPLAAPESLSEEQRRSDHGRSSAEAPTRLKANNLNSALSPATAGGAEARPSQSWPQRPGGAGGVQPMAEGMAAPRGMIKGGRPATGT